MDHIEININQILQEMTRIRRLKGKVITNYYNQCQNYELPMQCLIGNKSCVFIWRDKEINRVYFYSSDEDELVQLLLKMPKGAVIDYITKEKEDNTTLFSQAGYYRKFEYGRFAVGEETEFATEMNALLKEDKKIYEDLYQSFEARPARVEEAEELDSCLREKFDPYEAHFYDMDTLREYIRKNWVWIVKESNKIIAADIFEIRGKKVYGAFLFNNGPVGVLTSLLNAVDAYIAEFKCLKSYCWMNLKNKRVLRYNLTYCGYKFDGVYDIIYIKS